MVSEQEYKAALKGITDRNTRLVVLYLTDKIDEAHQLDDEKLRGIMASEVSKQMTAIDASVAKMMEQVEKGLSRQANEHAQVLEILTTVKNYTVTMAVMQETIKEIMATPRDQVPKTREGIERLVERAEATARARVDAKKRGAATVG